MHIECPVCQQGFVIIVKPLAEKDVKETSYPQVIQGHGMPGPVSVVQLKRPFVNSGTTFELNAAQETKYDTLTSLQIHEVRIRYERGDALARVRHDLKLNVPLSRLQAVVRKPYH